jgi:proteasome lid subunit RPN8/RPN11
MDVTSAMGQPVRDVVELPADVYRKIIRHSLTGFHRKPKDGFFRSPRWNEIIGALIGKFKSGTVEIVDAIELGEGTSSYVLATDYGRIFEKSNLEEQLLRDDTDRVSICGWYHSHPGYKFFLSGIDKATQTYYQRQHEQAIALVVDPTTIFLENDTGIRVFRIQDSSLFGIKEIQLDVQIVGLEDKSREMLNELIKELGFDHPSAIFQPELEEPTPKLYPTPLNEIQITLRGPTHVDVGEPFSIAIAVEGISSGILQLTYELVLPDHLTMLTPSMQKMQGYHEVMTNGTVRVFRVRAEREAAFDLVLDNIMIANFYEAVSLGRHELTVVAESSFT